jgi:hypothetical protein
MAIGLTEPALAGGRVCQLVRQALSDDPRQFAEARHGLREIGPGVLDRLFEMKESAKAANDAKTVQRIEETIDHVCAQRFASVSRLFWHTDLEAAQDVSSKSGKPILSLRLMGNLTDEYSCANSRFFRTLLYANADVSKYLRDNFVLHWKSVRPVPQVTIDYGDGRVLKRTITGNSIHYVLDTEGLVIDALPGLYSPEKFVEGLERARQIANSLARANPSTRVVKGVTGKAGITMVSTHSDRFRDYHASRLREIHSQWAADLARIGQPVTPPVATERWVREVPTAEQGARVAKSKAAVEWKMVRDITLDFDELEKTTDDATWLALGKLHEADVRFDDSSSGLIAAAFPSAHAASELAVSKRVEESPLLRMVAKLRHNVSTDSIRNEYDLHRRIHEWLAATQPQRDVEALNERIYAELFLTPNDDPWIGLVSADTYTALTNAGIQE